MARHAEADDLNQLAVAAAASGLRYMAAVTNDTTPERAKALKLEADMVKALHGGYGVVADRTFRLLGAMAKAAAGPQQG